MMWASAVLISNEAFGLGHHVGHVDALDLVVQRGRAVRGAGGLDLGAGLRDGHAGGLVGHAGDCALRPKLLGQETTDLVEHVVDRAGAPWRHDGHATCSHDGRGATAFISTAPPTV